MKIKDIFKTIHKGTTIDKYGNYNELQAFLLDTSDINNCVVTTSSEELETVRMNVKDKHLLHAGDIVIASIPSSKTSHVGYVSSVPSEYPIIIKKNIIVLRDIDERYNPLFIAEYLETIGIKQLYTNSILEEKDPIQLEDIEKLDIPDIPIERQNQLVDLFRPINRRTELYKQLLENDSKIKKYLMEREISHEK